LRVCLINLSWIGVIYGSGTWVLTQRSWFNRHLEAPTLVRVLGLICAGHASTMSTTKIYVRSATDSKFPRSLKLDAVAQVLGDSGNANIVLFVISSIADDDELHSALKREAPTLKHLG